MTVKLAKLFGTSTASNNSSAQVPPPLPPPNPAPVYNYYNHPQLQQKLQKPYNPYMDDDDDDNMSLYSTTASIMTSRDHPFNNSQRPLLADRKPQLLLTQNNNNNKKKNSTTNQQNSSSQTSYQQQQLLKQQQQYNQQQQQQFQEKSYISPYVQQQKRDSAKGLHGFNDFDILSQQYNQHLQSPHIGYPYGSPPSPTRTSTHTTATTSSTSALQNIAANNATAITTTDFVFDSLATTYGNNKQQQQNQPFASISTALTSTPRYGNINNYGSTTSANVFSSSSASSNSVTNIISNSSRPCYDVNDADYYTVRPSTDAMLGKSSRFEDDFCSRRNIDFSKNTHLDGGVVEHQQQQQQQLQSGPFIFGIPPEQQTDFTRMPHGGRSFGDISEDSGITKDDDKYSAKRMQQSTSDTSSTSRDDSTTTTNTSNDGTSRSSRKGAAKFLLRKRNTKKSATKESKALKSQDKACVKCVVVGDCAVGKTNLILSYLENRFNTEHVPTASDIYNADVMVNDSPVHLTLCDTAGQDTLDPLRELCYPDSDVFLLCFSVAKPETFHAIKTKWAPRFSNTKASLILVGTQADLRTNPNVLNKLQSNGEQPISYADAWDLATTIGAKYIETSSATQDKVKDVFDAAIWEGLAPTTLPPTPIPFWKKLFCLA
ncbi:Rho-related GTP-binding protein RhoU [Lucilia cuprina]|nr:Rho-related GTP-binding protein RhoU [Lucilia cuprina]